MATTAVSTPAGTPKPLHPLRNRNFLLFFGGGSISLLGDQFYFVALPWLVLEQTNSVVAMSAIMMSGAIPRAVLMLMGGVLSDRISPRQIMIAAAWARSGCVAAIGLLAIFHLLKTWELYVLAAAFGMADAFDGPAEQAFLPFLVERERLVEAMSVSQSGAQLATILGPVPAGFVIKVLGTAWAFLLDAVSFLFLIGALRCLPDPPPVASEPKPIWNEILEGIQYVWKDIPLRSFVLLAMCMNFCLSGPIEVGLVYLVKTRFASPATLGVVLSAVAAGLLAGSLLAGIWKIRRRGIMILFVSFALALLLGPMGWIVTRWGLASVLLVMGITAGLANVHISAWTMQRIDADMLGRISSVLILSSVGIIPISMAAVGLLIAVSLKFMFVVASSLLLLVSLAAALQKTVRQIE